MVLTGDPQALEDALKNNGLERIKVKQENQIFRTFAVATDKSEGAYDQIR